MKRLFFSAGIFVFTILLFASCSNQKKNVNSFSVAINIKGLKPAANVVLERQVNNAWDQLDSTTLKDGKGTITGEIKSPAMYYLAIKKLNIYMPFWLENSKITVSAGLNSWKHPAIKGSETQNEYEAFQDSVKTFYQQEKPVIEKIRKAEAAKKEKEMMEARDQYAKIDNQRLQYVMEYAKRHNKSNISPYLVLNNCYFLSLENLESITNNFDSTLVQNPYLKLLKNRVAILKSVAPGQHFTNFTLDNPKGKLVSLSSVVDHNKYTLVDFWASWCPDCRAENPNIVAAFKKFHRKGFTVFGVSFDDNHTNWVNGIKQQNLDWTQVSDLKGWQSAAGKLYGVESIPHNLLINQKGIIVAQDLMGPALQKELKKLMK